MAVIEKSVAIIDIVVDIRLMGLLLVQVGTFFEGFMVFHDGCCMYRSCF